MGVSEGKLNQLVHSVCEMSDMHPGASPSFHRAQVASLSHDAGRTCKLHIDRF